MTRTGICAAMCAMAAGASLADAKSLKQAPARLDPAKAYVLVELRADQGSPGQLTLARYDRTLADVKGFGRAKAAAPVAGQVREWTGKALRKEPGRQLHLLEVEPDFWVVEGANGTAFSLGSTGVTLSAGKVTDLGVATLSVDYADGDGPEKLTAGKLAKVALLGPFGGGLKPKPVPAMVSIRPRSESDLPIPEAIRPATVVAEWSEPVKFGNHLGGLVNRLGGRRARPGTATADQPR